MIFVIQKEEKLMRLEKAINPLLDDNDMVALSYIFSKAIDEHMKTVENVSSVYLYLLIIFNVDVTISRDFHAIILHNVNAIGTVIVYVMSL